MISGKKIRDYTVEHKLGSGRYGVCFLARDSHGRQVVLKRFRRHLFREHRIFTEEDIFRVGSQLTESLVYIHSRSVVHGDLSISNIVDDGHRIGILDFGLARYRGEDGAAYDLDYACLGNVLLYLSTPVGTAGRKEPGTTSLISAMRKRPF